MRESSVASLSFPRNKKPLAGLVIVTRGKYLSRILIIENNLRDRSFLNGKNILMYPCEDTVLCVLVIVKVRASLSGHLSSFRHETREQN